MLLLKLWLFKSSSKKGLNLMKLWKIMLLLIVSTIFMISCKKPSIEDRYYDAHTKMMEIDSYQTIVKIHNYTGENNREYVFKQMFKNPDKYRLEVMSPENLKGNTTIFNGKTAWIQHDAINQTWKMDSFEHSNEQLMFIGYFLENFINSEESKYHSETFNGEDTIVITTELPGGNPNFYRQNLWIDIEDFTPLKLNITDNEDKAKFEVYYENFKMNPQLEDSLFYLESK